MSPDEESWFQTGYPEPERITEKQKALLGSFGARVFDILTPEERVCAELMDPGEWVDSLSKYEASRLITRVMNNKVVEDVRQVLHGGAPLWWDTGISRGAPVGKRRKRLDNEG